MYSWVSFVCALNSDHRSNLCWKNTYFFRWPLLIFSIISSPFPLLRRIDVIVLSPMNTSHQIDSSVELNMRYETAKVIRKIIQPIQDSKVNTSINKHMRSREKKKQIRSESRTASPLFLKMVSALYYESILCSGCCCFFFQFFLLPWVHSFNQIDNMREETGKTKSAESCWEQINICINV